VVGIVGWLLGLARDEATTAAVAGLAEGIIGSTEERALRSALENAARVTARQLVEDRQQQEFLGKSLAELLLSDTDVFDLRVGQALEDLESVFAARLAALWQYSTEEGSTHAEEIGLAQPPGQVVSMLVSEFIQSLGLECAPPSPLVGLIALLQGQQNRRDIDRFQEALLPGLIARNRPGFQASQINAWISLAEDPPTVFVVNLSDAPIFDVRPTPALIGYGEDGHVTAQVGHAPLSITRQVDPGGAWAWPLDHCQNWGGEASVRGQLHVEFEDAAGRRWRLAHDHLSPAGDLSA
jgi:hypothetical protein